MTTLNTTTTNVNEYTVEDLQLVRAAALQHAADTAQQYMDYTWRASLLWLCLG